VAIYLIRHAHAGSRSGWDGDDDRRPLSDKGRGEAKQIFELLRDQPITAIYSSPTTRCAQTVEPLADEHGLTIQTTALLYEGAGAHDVIAFLLDHADENPAASSHGDVIPKVIRHLKSAGMRTSDPSDSSKGSVWVLDVEDGVVVRGTYHPPA
jgi:broad specificity phosphatase PhoE